MHVYGVDPGYNFTGVGMLAFATDDLGDPIPESMFAEAEQFANPREARDWIYRRALGPLDARHEVLVVEDYIGSGHLTKEAKQTVQVLGYFRYASPVATTYLQVPQKRLAHVDRARELLEESSPGQPWPAIKDAVAALAHALAWVHGSYGD